MHNLVQLGCCTPLGDSKVLDVHDLQGRNEALGAVSMAIMEWNYNKLRQRDIKIENTSIAFPPNFIGEMAKNYSDLKEVFSAITTSFLRLEILPLRNIELKADITEKALEFLKADILRCAMVADIVEEVGDFLSGRHHKMELYTDSDLELFDFERLILSIEVAEGDYDKILELWDEIEEIIEGIVNSMKELGYDASRIDAISETLLIRTKRMENV